MRSGTRILATCAIVGLALGVGRAEDWTDTTQAGYSLEEPTRRRTVEYFSRSSELAQETERTATSWTTQTGGQAAQARNPASTAGVPSRYKREGKLRELKSTSILTSRVPGVPGERAEHAASTVEAVDAAAPAVPHTERLTPARSIVMQPKHKQPDTPAEGRSSPSPPTDQMTAEEQHPSVATQHKQSSEASDADSRKNIVHAEYEKRGDESEAGAVQQVQAYDKGLSSFDISDEDVTHGGTAPGDDDSHSQGRRSPLTQVVATRASSAIDRDAAPALGTESQTPSISLRWEKHTDINVGQECECRLILKNNGDGLADDVIVDAHFPSSVRLTAAMPRPSNTHGHLSWNFETLQPGVEKTIRIRMIPHERGALPTMAYVRFTGASSGSFQVEEPMLQLSLKGPKQVMVGDPASQIITVSNPGSGVANNVKIESNIPQGLEHVRGESLVMDIGSLNPGETRTLRLALAAVSGGNHTVKITAQADAALTQSATADIHVVAPSIKVSLEGPSLRYIGRNAQYTLSVLNDGAAASNNVRVVHRIPEGFEFASADEGGKYDPSGRTASWFVGRLEPGQSTRLNVVLLPVKLGDYVHRAGVVSEHGAKSTAEFETQVEGTASLVLEIVDRDDPVEVGVETAYEVRVRNDGSKAAKNVALSCELPQGVTLIRAKGPTEHIAENGLVVFKNIGQLQPEKTAIYRVHLKGRVEGNHRFRARLASDSIREPLIFEELTRFYGD